MSIDLRGALLAAAEDAGKMQADLEQKIENLTSYIDYVESENTKLKSKLSKAAELARQFAEILSDDQNA